MNYTVRSVIEKNQENLFLDDQISELMPFKHMKSWNNIKQHQKL